MDTFKKFFNKEDLICSYNFARNSNVVYSEVVSKKQFENLNIKNPLIIYEDSGFVFYKLKEFEIRENDIIFCNLYMIDSLFLLLKNETKLKNIKLITSQSDKSVDKKLFKTKPKCISEWYSTNVNYYDEKLFPIPLGVANEHPKNLQFMHFAKQKEVKVKNELAYINFEKNTNFFKRNKIIRKLKKYKWVFTEDTLLSLDEYLFKLKSYQFIISPPGNGIDTHRVWETLYAGSYPIVEKHLAMNSFIEFPILFVDNLSRITFHEINFLKKSLNNFDREILKVNYWMKKIDRNRVDNINYVLTIRESEESSNKTLANYQKNLKIEKNLKKLNTVLRKLYSFIFN